MMMPPALLLLRIGRVRQLVLPVPLFLLWPLVLVAGVVLGLAWLVTLGRARCVVAGFLILQALSELRGTRVDFRGQDGAVYLRFI